MTTTRLNSAENPSRALPPPYRSAGIATRHRQRHRVFTGELFGHEQQHLGRQLPARSRRIHRIVLLHRVSLKRHVVTVWRLSRGAFKRVLDSTIYDQLFYCLHGLSVFLLGCASREWRSRVALARVLCSHRGRPLLLSYRSAHSRHHPPDTFCRPFVTFRNVCSVILFLFFFLG